MCLLSLTRLRGMPRAELDSTACPVVEPHCWADTYRARMAKGTAPSLTATANQHIGRDHSSLRKTDPSLRYATPMDIVCANSRLGTAERLTGPFPKAIGIVRNRALNAPRARASGHTLLAGQRS